MQEELSQRLLAWYQNNGRNLPWRVRGGAHPNPYVILVSEVMLQQTTVKTVIPYFERFMNRFPTVESLAEADINEVYLYWQGLGYYSRARSLHRTAKQIVNEYQGEFPTNKEAVLKLKGIGPYTAASFLALAYNQPETVVDGNVIRIICRLYHLTEPVEKILPLIRQQAEKLTDKKSPADYASAIMDLGALICTPKNPQCLLCPLKDYCISKSTTDLEAIPNKKKSQKPLKSGNVYVITNPQGEVYIKQRQEKGLLSGLYEFPWSEEELFATFPKTDTNVEVTHVFTHFKLVLHIYKINHQTIAGEGIWVKIADLTKYPFSTLMKKVIQVSLF